ncbi:MAG TPA: hypothetical protein VGI81_01865 [Tepidisphaeraceae bacterium]|jgi:hypothetical protein
MALAWTRITSVKDDGIVELAIPELSRGQMVEVSVQLLDDASKRGEGSSQFEQRPLGLLKGKIVMSADFDAPLPEFDDYT